MNPLVADFSLIERVCKIIETHQKTSRLELALIRGTDDCTEIGLIYDNLDAATALDNLLAIPELLDTLEQWTSSDVNLRILLMMTNEPTQPTVALAIENGRLKLGGNLESSAIH